MKTRHLKLILLVLVFICASVFALSSCMTTDSTVDLYDGTQLIRSEGVAPGSTYSFTPPTKTGYTFIGWYSSATGGSVYTDADGSSAGRVWSSDNPTALYAHWSANEYTLKFDYGKAEPGENPTQITVLYDSNITSNIPIPELSGYDFVGWYNESNNGTMLIDADGGFCNNAEVYNSNSYNIKNGGTTLYARFVEKTVTFHFVTEDGSAVADKTYKLSEVIHSLPNTVLDNYCFMGWYLDANYYTQISFPYVIPQTMSGTVNLYAKFEEGSDVLTFTLISSTGDREYSVSYTGDAARLVVPDSYNGKPVTMVGSINSSTVEEVCLPQSILSFANGAFENCTSLVSVNIPNSMKSISDSAFLNCSSLQKIYIPQSVESIGKFAFSGCSSITEINIPANVSKIDSGAFRNMSSLANILVSEDNVDYFTDDGVLYKKVGTSAYLIQYPAAKEGASYTTVSNVNKIEDYAFSSSTLKSILIGGKVSAIEEGAFENCQYLMSVSINSSAAKITIYAKAFAGCSRLKLLKIENDVVPDLQANVFVDVPDNFAVYVPSAKIKSYQTASNWRNLSIYSFNDLIGNYAVEEVDGGYMIRQYFGDATELVLEEKINGKNIVCIGDYAFAYSALERITINSNIASIGGSAFKGSSSLKNIIMKCQPPVLGTEVFVGVHADYTVHIDGASTLYDEYAVAAGWSEIFAAGKLR